VYRAAPRPSGHADTRATPPCVLKVVNLGPNCKIREDYKPILRSEGRFLEHFDQPGFVRCFETWGGAAKHECVSPDCCGIAALCVQRRSFLDRYCHSCRRTGQWK
jgi:hypothetical protein